MKYRILWAIEIALVLLLLFVILVPVQDYAMREYKEYLDNPSSETLKTFQKKREEESLLRGIIAVTLGAMVSSLAIPIFRIRNRSSK